MRRIVLLCCLVPCLLPLGGCLSTLIGLAAAPEAMAAGAVGGAADAVASNISGASVASLSDSQGMIRDLDRIIADHPDAANVGELTSLRDELVEKDRKGSSDGAAPRRAPRIAKVPEAPERLSRAERLTARGADSADQFALLDRTRPPRATRGLQRLPTPPARPSAEPALNTVWHQYSLEPVRLGNR